LNDIERKLGVTADDVTVGVGEDGLIEMKIPRDVAQKIIDQRNLPGLSHALSLGSLTVEERAATVVDVIANEFGLGLLSTQERFDLGLQYMGGSSESDMSTGGADYVYLTMVGYDQHRTAQKGELIHDDDDNVFIFYDPVEVLTRLDLWANQEDYFGGRVHNDPVGHIKPEGYELMLKRHLDNSAMSNIYVGAELRNFILKELDKRGVTEINGVPVRDFVRLFGNEVDPDEWKTGDDLVSKAEAIAKIMDRLKERKMLPPYAGGALNVPNEAGTMTLAEEYGLASNPDHSIIAIEKGTGTLITLQRRNGKPHKIVAHKKYVKGEFRQPGRALNPKAIENLEKMIEDGSISDFAVVYGRYGRYGKAGAEAPTGSGEAFYKPVFDDFLKKAKSSDPKLQKQGVFGLIDLLKTDIPPQLRLAIFSQLSGMGLMSEARAALLGGPATTKSKFRKGDRSNPFWVG